jgi:hypothetical protein
MNYVRYFMVMDASWFCKSRGIVQHGMITISLINHSVHSKTYVRIEGSLRAEDDMQSEMT